MKQNGTNNACIFIYCITSFLRFFKTFFSIFSQFYFYYFLFLDHCVLNCNMITLKWRNFYLFSPAIYPGFFIKTHAEWMKCFASSSSSCGLKSQIRSTFSIWTTMEKGKTWQLCNFIPPITSKPICGKRWNSLLDNASLAVLSKKEWHLNLWSSRKWTIYMIQHEYYVRSK